MTQLESERTLAYDRSVLEIAQQEAASFRDQVAASNLPIAIDSPDGTAGPMPDQPPLAYRLTSPSTSVYERPDSSSEKLFDLPTGSLITVSEGVGDFLHVITPRDCFGYIRWAASMTPVDVPS